MNVAVIGTGSMGAVHAAAWARMPGVRLAGLAGQNADRTRAAAQRYGIRAYACADEALDDAGVDVVDLCLPTHLHKHYALMAAECGKHVICEKPIAASVDEAAEMIEACRRQGVRLFIAHVLRFFPAYIQAREWIVGGKLGRVGSVALSRRGTSPRGSGDWYANPAWSGGVVLDLLIHDLDWLRWTFGPIERIRAVAPAAVAGSEVQAASSALLSVRTRSGVMARLDGSWEYTSFRSSFDIAGSLASLSCRSDATVPLSVVTPKASPPWDGAPVAVPSLLVGEDPYYRQLHHFHACIASGCTPVVTAEDALEALRLARAAIDSMRTGAPIAPVV